MFPKCCLFDWSFRRKRYTADSRKQVKEQALRTKVLPASSFHAPSRRSRCHKKWDYRRCSPRVKVLYEKPFFPACCMTFLSSMQEKGRKMQQKPKLNVTGRMCPSRVAQEGIAAPDPRILSKSQCKSNFPSPAHPGSSTLHGQLLIFGARACLIQEVSAQCSLHLTSPRHYSLKDQAWPRLPMETFTLASKTVAEFRDGFLFA